MEEQVLEILRAEKTEDSIFELCVLCSIRDYQANKYIDMYKKLTEIIEYSSYKASIGHKKKRDEILNKLVSGAFSTNEAKVVDFRTEIIKLLQSDDLSYSVNKISELCNISEGDAAVVVEKFKSITNSEISLRAVDTMDSVNRRWRIIDELAATFIPDRPF